jgi:hypothetical protein
MFALFVPWMSFELFFFRHRFSEIKIVSLKNQPAAYAAQILGKET